MNEEIKKKIIELALQGLTSKEIEEKIPDIDEDLIKNYISSLNSKESTNHNPKLYDQILFARNVRNKEIIDYDKIEDIIQLVFQNFTFLEIGLLYNMSESEITSTLLRALKGPYAIYRDEELYKRVIEKQSSTIKKNFDQVFERLNQLEEDGVDLKTLPKNIVLKKWKSQKNKMNLIMEYVDCDGKISTQALATKYHFSISYVESIILGESDRAFTEQLIGKEKLAEIRQKLLAQKQEKKDKLKDEFDLTNLKDKRAILKIEKQKNFWIAFMLTFRVSYDFIGRLNLIPKKSVYQIKYYIEKNLDEKRLNALNYLMNVESNAENQKELENKAQAFYHTMLISMSLDQKEKTQYLNVLKDDKYLKVKEKKEIYTPEDYQTIIDYTLKYALPLPYDYELLQSMARPDQKPKLEQLKEYLQQTIKR